MTRAFLVPNPLLSDLPLFPDLRSARSRLFGSNRSITAWAFSCTSSADSPNFRVVRMRRVSPGQLPLLAEERQVAH
jgi:hypothetical protein